MRALFLPLLVSLCAVTACEGLICEEVEVETDVDYTFSEQEMAAYMTEYGLTEPDGDWCQMCTWAYTNGGGDPTATASNCFGGFELMDWEADSYIGEAQCTLTELREECS